MKVESSAYLRAAKPYLKELVAELNKIYPYASVLGQDSLGKSFRVSRSGMSASESGMLTAHGFVVRVWDGGFAEYSFNALPELGAAEFAKMISETVQPPLTVDKRPADETLTLCESTEFETDPEELGGEKILAALTDIREYAMRLDERLLDCSASCNFQKSHKIFLSPNRDLEQNALWTTAGVMALASRGEEIKDEYRSFSGLAGAEVLDKMRDGVAKCVQTAIDLLDSTPIEPGEYECICAPEVTGMIVHEAFGHGVEMDMFVKKRALAQEYVGKYVASPLVTMHDGAASAKQTATWFFDDEGTVAQDTIVIDKGVLVNGICDEVSAGRLHAKATGNGRRESFKHKAYTRMTNTFFEGGTDRVEDMIASIKSGYLLESPSSGMEDPKNWGIQCMVGIAREIKDGKLTGKICSPIVLTGYVPDLLRSISMMSENVELSGSGFCGKGHKEWVTVSDGGPYIKAKIRLG